MKLFLGVCAGFLFLIALGIFNIAVLRYWHEGFFAAWQSILLFTLVITAVIIILANVYKAK